MSERIHALAQQLFGKASVEECSLQEAKDLAKDYPYFAPAQFLLLQKLKHEGSPEYNKQLQRSLLYYHNPLEFEYFINSEKFYTELKMDEGTDDETQLSTKEHLHSKIEDDKETLHQTSIETEHDEIQSTQFPEDNSLEKPAEDLHTIPESGLSQIENVSELFQEPLIEEHKEVDSLPTHTAEENRDHEDPYEVNESEDQSLSVKLKSLFNQPDYQNKPLDEAIAEVKPEIAFEPYHTIDYFASQGIKAVQEETPQDKFGKQLKSFTQWLKAMKRLPANEAQKNIDPATEVKLVNMANDSVHEANVVTEAMAEVWLKQGNTEKAIEIYNKLSLLDPSKRSFFAAKIEHLKHS